MVFLWVSYSLSGHSYRWRHSIKHPAIYQGGPPLWLRGAPESPDWHWDFFPLLSSAWLAGKSPINMEVSSWENHRHFYGPWLPARHVWWHRFVKHHLILEEVFKISGATDPQWNSCWLVSPPWSTTVNSSSYESTINWCLCFFTCNIQHTMDLRAIDISTIEFIDSP